MGAVTERRVQIRFDRSLDSTLDPSHAGPTGVVPNNLRWDSARSCLVPQPVFSAATPDPTVSGTALVRTFAFGDRLLALTRNTSRTWLGPDSSRVLLNDAVTDGVWSTPLGSSNTHEVPAFQRVREIQVGGEAGEIAGVNAILSADGTELAVTYTAFRDGTTAGCCRVYSVSDGTLLLRADQEATTVSPVPTEHSDGWRFWSTNTSRNLVQVRTWTRSTNTLSVAVSVITVLSNVSLHATGINQRQDALVAVAQNGTGLVVRRFNGTSTSSVSGSNITIAGATLNGPMIASRDAGDVCIVSVQDTASVSCLLELVTLGSNTRTNKLTQATTVSASLAADPTQDLLLWVSGSTGSRVFSTAGALTTVGPTPTFTTGPTPVGGCAIVRGFHVATYTNSDYDGRKGSVATVVGSPSAVTHMTPQWTFAGLELTQPTTTNLPMHQAGMTGSCSLQGHVALPVLVGERPGAAAPRVYVAEPHVGDVTAAQVGPYLVMGGAAVTVHDGAQLIDAGGSHGRPLYSATSTTGGSLVPRRYYLSVSSAVRDNVGRVHVGLPARVATGTVFGGGSALSITARSVFSRALGTAVGQGHHASQSVWRTIAAQTSTAEYNELPEASSGAVPWLAAVPKAATIDTGGALRTTQLLTDNDDVVSGVQTIKGGQNADIAPWFGAPELGPPSPAQHVLYTGTHIVTYGLPNPRQLQVSMPIEADLPPRWVGPGAPEYSSFFLELPQPVVAAWMFEGLLYVASASSVWVFEGSGPNDRGQGGYGTPRIVSEWEGVTSPHQVAVCPRGAVAVGGASGRIGLITRAGWAWIGDAFDDTLTGRTIRAIGYDPEYRQVVVDTSNARIFWHEQTGQWAFSNVVDVRGDQLGYSPVYGLFTSDEALGWYREPATASGIRTVSVLLRDLLGLAGRWGAIKEIELHVRHDALAGETLTVSGILHQHPSGSPLTEVLPSRTLPDAGGTVQTVRWSPKRAQQSDVGATLTVSSSFSAGSAFDSLRLLGLTLVVEDDSAGAAGRKQTKASLTG